MSRTKFRQELKKIMPFYKWTVHRAEPFDEEKTFMEATGIVSSGMNRISTLYIRRDKEKKEERAYTAKSAGFGLKTPWLSEYTAATLAQALRGLQVHYEYMAQEYRAHAESLQSGRGKPRCSVCGSVAGEDHKEWCSVGHGKVSE